MTNGKKTKAKTKAQTAKTQTALKPAALLDVASNSLANVATALKWIGDHLSPAEIVTLVSLLRALKLDELPDVSALRKSAREELAKTPAKKDPQAVPTAKVKAPVAKKTATKKIAKAKKSTDKSLTPIRDAVNLSGRSGMTVNEIAKRCKTGVGQIYDALRSNVDFAHVDGRWYAKKQAPPIVYGR